ncbi:unnamed protein product [Parnassius apollo]|uniref:(apollo) hypothetical protein n=1 Tax=Parnassius apollo TaxID=110799 RepID=A0A8S3X2X7_PARAO|nr:unnamed protein product [Parnassius apollo]
MEGKVPPFAKPNASEVNKRFKDANDKDTFITKNKVIRCENNMPQYDVPDLDINFQAPIDSPTCVSQSMDSDMTLETKSKSLAYDNVPEMNTHYDADFSPDDSGEEYRPEKVKRTYPLIGSRRRSSSNSSSSSSCTSSSIISSSKNTSTQSVAILSQNQPFILNQD